MRGVNPGSRSSEKLVMQHNKIDSTRLARKTMTKTATSVSYSSTTETQQTCIWHVCMHVSRKRQTKQQRELVRLRQPPQLPQQTYSQHPNLVSGSTVRLHPRPPARVFSTVLIVTRNLHTRASDTGHNKKNALGKQRRTHLLRGIHAGGGYRRHAKLLLLLLLLLQRRGGARLVSHTRRFGSSGLWWWRGSGAGT